MIEFTIALFVGLICIFIYVIIDAKKKKDHIFDSFETEEILIEEPKLVDLTAKLTESYLTLENYIGQSKSIEYLKGHIEQAQKENRALSHIILWGPGGLGKSTLIKAVANKIGGRYIEIVPANLKSTKELFGVFFYKKCNYCGYLNPYSCNKCLSCKEDINIEFSPELLLQDKDIIFLEECHRLRSDVEEALYSLMQDGYMMVRYNGVDQRVDFPNVTIAGATTLLSNLNGPFKDRFKIIIHIIPYTPDEISRIIVKYADHKKYDITNLVTDKISRISHGVPRIAKKYIDDCATLSYSIDIDKLDKILYMLGIDEFGLDDVHRKILKFIYDRMNASKNGAAGASSIATSVGISTDDYLELYEPGLIYQELIFQSARGRRLTDKCVNYYFPK